MRDNTNSQPPSLDTATWLRRADKFVKDKSYEAALDAIAKARQLDPTNPYALAYEERVRALMRADKGSVPSQPSKKEVREEDARASPPPLEQISHLAMQQAQSNAAASAMHRHEISARKREEEDRKRQDENRKAALRSKLAASVARAEQYLEKKEFDQSLGEISRALLLDPKNAEVLSFEKRVRDEQEETHRTREKERARQLEEEGRKRQEQLQTERERIRQEQQERKNKDDEARRQAQKQKIDQYLERSSSHLAAGRLQEAQNELAFVVVIEPLNPQVLALQQQIRDAYESQRLAELEHRRKQEEEEKKRQEATKEAIQKHLDNATKLAAAGSFTEALRVVTLAYVLDPLNEQTQSCENKILAAHEADLSRAAADRNEQQEQQRRKEEEERLQFLHAERQQLLEGNNAEIAARSRENQEKCKMHLTRGQEHLSLQQFEGALAEVALAFMIDPFSNEVKQMEHDVRNAQAEYMQGQGEPAVPPPTDSAAIADQIAEHVAAARRLHEQHEYARALDELARAFILDPLDPSIQKCEEAIQSDLTLQEQGRQNAGPAGQPEEGPHSEDRISRAQEFIARQAYDDALSEIALGLALKPGDKILQQLESTVWELKSRSDSGKGESRGSETDETEQSRRDDLLRSHLQAADGLIRKGELAKALDELAKAFAIDPLNPATSAMESRIRQLQGTSKAKPKP